MKRRILSIGENLEIIKCVEGSERTCDVLQATVRKESTLWPISD